VPFTCLRTCLEKFTPHNIEVAAALLETCGRWLFRTPHTHQRMAKLLDAMMRIKRVSA
jgi:regulator of nonsense transcripts 2